MGFLVKVFNIWEEFAGRVIGELGDVFSGILVEMGGLGGGIYGELGCFDSFLFNLAGMKRACILMVWIGIAFLLANCNGRKINSTSIIEEDSIKQNGKDTVVSSNQPGEAIQDSVVNSIRKLQIILDEERMVDSLSNHTRRLSYRVLYDDSTKSKYYADVLEDNGGAYATHFVFYLDAKTMKILNPNGKSE